MAAYSLDLRQPVVRACEGGMPAAEVAARLDVSLAWVYRLLQRRRETGSIAPRTQTQFRGRALSSDEEVRLVRWQDTQPLHDARAYVFIDESGVTTDLLRRDGRRPRGVRLRDYTPCGHWQTHTVIAGLRVDGLTAPAVFDGPLDNPTFLASVEQVLTPTLRAGAVVVLDNLAMHKRPEVRAAIETRRRAPPVLAPYSPDFDPIEQAFAKLKAFLRAARPRHFDQVVELVAIALELFTPRECLNFVQHCGYRVSTAL